MCFVSALYIGFRLSKNQKLSNNGHSVQDSFLHFYAKPQMWLVNEIRYIEFEFIATDLILYK